MSKADLYATLGVDRAAEPDEIKRAYRRKAKKAHPDHGGSPQEFHELSRALAVLTDDRRRQHYDATGEIDEAQADNGHVEALNVIREMMAQIIEQAPDEIYEDIVEKMKGAMDAQVAKIKREAEGMRRKVLKLSRFAGKFTAKKGENFLRGMIEAKITSIEATIASADHAIVAITRARSIVADHAFEVDPRPESAWVITRFATSTAA